MLIFTEDRSAILRSLFRQHKGDLWGGLTGLNLGLELPDTLSAFFMEVQRPQVTS